MQLYELQRYHSSLMVVGGPGVGKTTCIQTLLRTLGMADNNDSSVYRETRLNPKSMDVDQLMGSFDGTTTDWVDGVFPVLLRRATRTTRGQSLTGHLLCHVSEHEQEIDCSRERTLLPLPLLVKQDCSGTVRLAVCPLSSIRQ